MDYSHISIFVAFSAGFLSFVSPCVLPLVPSFLAYQGIIQKIGGILIVLFGLYIMGIFKLSFLSSEKKFHIENKPAGFIGSFLVGMAFAAGWTPCVGPILGSILLYASTTGSVAKGMGLLAVYSLGLGLPFFISALAINTFIAAFKVITRYMRWINLLSGAFLILVGIMIFTDSLTFITTWFQKHGIGWSVEL